MLKPNPELNPEFGKDTISMEALKQDTINMEALKQKALESVQIPENM